VLSEWIRSYLDDCYALSTGTQDLYAYHLRAFLQATTDLPLHQLEPSHLRTYLAHLHRKDGKPYSPHYTHQVYRTLHTFLQWCVDQDGIEHNPLDKVRAPRLPQTKSPRLNLDQVESLLEAVKTGPHPARDLAMICLAVDSGLRRGEIIGLELDHLDVDAGVVRVIGKGNKEREVPVGSVTKVALNTWLGLRPRADTTRVFITRKGRPFTKNGIQTLMYRLKKRAGLPNVRWHLLRHTFANYFIANGGGLRKLQMILGHASVDTTARFYTNPELSELQDAHAKASPLANRKQKEQVTRDP